MLMFVDDLCTTFWWILFKFVDMTKFYQEKGNKKLIRKYVCPVLFSANVVFTSLKKVYLQNFSIISPV